MARPSLSSLSNSSVRQGTRPLCRLGFLQEIRRPRPQRWIVEHTIFGPLKISARRETHMSSRRGFTYLQTVVERNLRSCESAPMFWGSLSSLRQPQGATVFPQRRGDRPGDLARSSSPIPAMQICVPACFSAPFAPGLRAPFLALAWASRERRQDSAAPSAPPSIGCRDQCFVREGDVISAANRRRNR
jgi:hypothetical protein